MLGDGRFDEPVERFEHGERRIETTLRLSAYGDTGDSCAASLIGGVSILAMTGKSTHFKRFKPRGGLVSGLVVQSDNGMGVDGRVVVSLRSLDPDDPEPESVYQGEAVGGEFRIEVGRDDRRWRVQAHYLGRHPWTPCDSDVRKSQP